MNNKQHTITKSVTLSGVGLHTGVIANMTFLPAPANHGIKFQRVGSLCKHRRRAQCIGQLAGD